eukprot:6191694-Pleurochrysis_carterae.AAC.1
MTSSLRHRAAHILLQLRLHAFSLPAKRRRSRDSLGRHARPKQNPKGNQSCECERMHASYLRSSSSRFSNSSICDSRSNQSHNTRSIYNV